MNVSVVQRANRKLTYCELEFENTKRDILCASTADAIRELYKFVNHSEFFRPDEKFILIGELNKKVKTSVHYRGL